ncbi:hypothetical protein LCGC14_1769110, partial [marine sediment metagenome]
MNIIALDTCTESCSAALLYQGELFEYVEMTQRGHSELILGMLDKVLTQAGIGMSAIDVLAFGRGPGSFTGVRVGVGVAQGIAFARILPASFASLNRGFPSGSQRTLAFGLFTSLVGSAAGFGSLLGALVAEYGSWRSVFTYLIPPFLVLTILYVSLAPK